MMEAAIRGYAPYVRGTICGVIRRRSANSTARSNCSAISGGGRIGSAISDSRRTAQYSGVE